MYAGVRKSQGMRLPLLIAAVILMVAVALMATTGQAMAQTCLDDVSPLNDLNCTANDVQVAQYAVIQGPTNCIEGQPVTFTLQAQLRRGATGGNSDRFDIGLFVATDGGDALTGQCVRDWLSPVANLTNSNRNETGGSGPFHNASDGIFGDTCGDIRAAASGVVGGQPGYTFLNLDPITILCQDDNNNGYLDVGTATSWDNNAFNDGESSICTSIEGTLPGTTSKCRAQPVQVGTVTVLQSARIEVIKNVISPFATDSGRFNLQIDGTTRRANAYDTNLNTGVSGPVTSTGSIVVSAGVNNQGTTHTVGETAGDSTNLANYTTSIQCVLRGTSSSVGSSNNAGPLTIPVRANQDIVCTVTNRRNSALLELRKSLVPLTDPGLFTLGITGPNTNVSVGNQSNGGTTGIVTVLPGAYTLSETAANLGDYTSSLACVNRTGGATFPGLSGNTVTVANGNDVICTYTNVRNTGTLRVIKQVRGPVDASTQTSWSFNATGPTPRSTTLDVTGAGDQTHTAWTVNTGSYAIAESVGANTPSADYTTSVSCTGGTANGTPSADGRSISGITVGTGQSVVCTFINTRRSGTIKVIKELDPPSDPGLFNLSITGPFGLVGSVSNVGDGGETAAYTVATGAYSLAETAGTGTVLTDYTTTLRCFDGANASVEVPVVNNSVQVNAGQQIACIFLNTRNTGRLIVTKIVVSPEEPDPGRFDLYVNNSLERNDAADGDSTGELTRNTGFYAVSELAGTGTSLTDYTSEVSCTSGGATTTVSGTALENVPVTTGALTSCTITNTRNAGTVTIIKEGLGGAGTFDFIANGAALPSTFQITTSGSPNSLGQQEFSVPAGQHEIREGTLPAGWDFTSLRCNASRPSSSFTVNGQTAVIHLATGDNVTCTFTNTRRGALAVTKSVNWNSTPVLDGQTFTICIQGPSFPLGTEVGACQAFDPGETLTFSNLRPGAYSVFETDPTPQQGWLITVSEGSTQVAPGATATATVTNKRVVGPLVIEKEITGVYTSTYSWEITKTANPTVIDIFDGDSRNIDYTVEAVRTGPVDSDHSLLGEVRITNASTLTSALVEEPFDRLSTGATVPLRCVYNSAPVTTWPLTLPPQGQILCSYFIDLVPDVRIQGSNNVTVTLGNGQIFTGTAPIRWGAPTREIDRNLSVNDTPTGLSNTFMDSGTWRYQDNLSCEDGADVEFVDGLRNFLWTNTVSATGNINPVEPDDATVEVNCWELSIEKSANPSLTRTWDWAIGKVVTPIETTLYEDGSVTLDYTIDVTNTAQVDSDWTVTGTVWVRNPSTLTATLENLTDQLDGVNVTLDCAAPFVVPPASGGTPGVLACEYTQSVPDADTVVNEVRAVLFGRAYVDTATADFATAFIDNINDSITVTDTNQVGETFGPFTADGTETYSTLVSCADATYRNGRGTITLPNIAEIVELDKQANATARVNCVQYGDITITKTVSDSTPSSWSFDFTLSNAPAPTLRTVTDAAPSASWNDLLPGQIYTLQEEAPSAEWITSQILCEVQKNPGDPFQALTDNDPAPGFQIEVFPGENIQCTTENVATVDITATKTVIGATEWEFTFQLDGANTRTVTPANSVATWSNLTAGSYVLTEVNPGNEWIPGEFVCTVNGQPVTDAEPVISGFLLELKPGDDVSCGIENVRKGTLVVEKLTTPDVSAILTETFRFTGAVQVSLNAGGTASELVAPGVYTVTEIERLGWDLTNVVCTDSDSVQNGNSAVYTIAAGETVKCTFNNVQRARLIVEKVTSPAGDPSSFDFTLSPDVNFSLTGELGSNEFISPYLVPGSYTVEELTPAGWTLLSIVCDNEDSELALAAVTNPRTVTLSAGEVERCTFTNEKQGTLVVQKITAPANSSQSFAFTSTVAGNESFNLTGVAPVANTLAVSVTPGSYAVGEIALAGWRLTDLVCTDPTGDSTTAGSVATFQVASAERVVCTFTNTQDGSIQVEKVTAPAGAEQGFGFSGAINTTLAGGQSSEAVPVAPGTYTVAEAAVAGWDLTAITCTDPTGNSTGDVATRTATFQVAAGEAIKCTFTNTQRAGLGDFVWDDLNKDGLQDEGEPGIPNVTVKLFKPSDLTNPISTTTTNAGGNYSFKNLIPGEAIGQYVVHFTPPADRDFTIPNANGNSQDERDSDADPATGRSPVTTLAAGQTNNTVDAGMICVRGSITGLVFYDPNGNNVVDTGESPFVGNGAVKAEARINHIVVLTRNLRPGEAPSPEEDRAVVTVTTAGRFTFGGLSINDSFTIRIEDAALTAFGYGASNSSLAFDVKPTPCGATERLFGYGDAGAVIGDLVWYDTNVNGLQDEWFDGNDDGVITKNTVGSTSDGFISLKDYEFIDLNGNNAPDLEGELNKCGINTTGPTMQLIDPSNPANNRTALLGNTGRYRFRETATGPLNPNGTYTVVLNPDDAKLTEGAELYQVGGLCKPLPGAPAAASAAAIQKLLAQSVAAAEVMIAQDDLVCGKTTAFSLTTDLSTKPGNQDLTLDYGIVCISADGTLSLGNRVWKDINPNGGTTPEKRAGDGLQNSPTEVGIGGITVELWNPGADGVIGTADDFLIGTTTTGANGGYGFSGLLPDDYYLVFIKPVGSTAWSSQPNVGDDRSIDSDVTVDPDNPNRAVTGVINLVADSPDWDAALIDTSAAGSSDIGDRVWRDVNKNGIQDAGEVGVPNVRVELFRVGTAETRGAEAQSVADTKIGEQLTNASGNYLFSALDPASYYVLFTIPAGFSPSPQNVGSNRETDSDINAAGRTATFELPPLTADLSWDAGIYPTPTNDPEDPEEMPNRIFLPVIGNQ